MATHDSGWAGVEAAVAALAGVEAVVVLDAVDSTNLEARRRLDAGAGPGLVVCARRQTAGRGRRERTWHDVERGNIALSVTADLPPAASLVPLATALALREVFEHLGLATSLKWPNDVRVRVDGVVRKCAGILAETVPVAGAVDRVVVGVGIDLDWRGRGRSGEASGWTSVAEALDGDVDPAEVVVGVVTRLLHQLGRLQARSPDVLVDYRAACTTLGRRVRVEGDDHVLVGTARDLAADGALVLDVDGREVVMSAGDVVHLRES